MLSARIALALSLSTTQVGAYGQTLSSSFPDGSNYVWAMVEPHGLPDYQWNQPSAQDSMANGFYQELYPIELSQFGYHVSLPSSAKYMAASGFNGEVVLQNAADGGGLSSYMTDAEGSGTGMKVALGLEGLTGEDDAVRLITNYVAAATNHTSAATIVDHGTRKWVVYIYWVRMLAATGANSWADVLSRLNQNGINVYFVADTGPIPWIFDQTDLQPYLAVLPAFYSFIGYPYGGYTWGDVFQEMNEYKRPFAGGLMPGYARENVANAGFEDAAGTQFFRNGWAAMLAGMSNLNGRWMTGVTWNDTVERTEIRPTSNWNWTRADLNNFYSVHFRGLPNPITSPKLYVTTPQEVHLNEKSVAESLIINWSTSPMVAQIQLQDDQGDSIGSPVTTTVEANSIGGASLPVCEYTLPNGRFLRALATMKTTSGRVVQTVESAPILVYDRFECLDLKMLYYSIPADRALPGTVGLELSESPVSSSSATATVTPPKGTSVRFTEVLQNTRQVVNFFNSSPATCPIPQNYVAAVDSYAAPGFYVGRVIDNQERVGYSNPVYCPAATESYYYSLTNVYSGLALDVAGSSAQAAQVGATLVQNALVPGKKTQDWALQSLGEGLYRIVNRYSGNASQTTSAPLPILMNSELAIPAQGWSLKYVYYNGRGAYVATNASNGLTMGLGLNQSGSGGKITDQPIANTGVMWGTGAGQLWLFGVAH